MGKYHTAIMKSLYAKKPRVSPVDAPDLPRNQSRDKGSDLRPKTTPRTATCPKPLKPVARQNP